MVHAKEVHAARGSKYARYTLQTTSSDDDDDERQFGDMEGHDMDNDFEGGQWVEGEYFYANKRKKRPQTKDQRLYGMCASSSSHPGLLSS